MAIVVHSLRPSMYLSDADATTHPVSAKLSLDRCGTDRSYADDVRKEMTRPSTVPRTVRIALETDNLWGVISDTSVTTVRSRVSKRGGYGG